MFILCFASLIVFYTPSTSSPARKTVHIMEIIGVVIKEGMKRSSHSNVIEYVSQIMHTQCIPDVISDETMEYIVTNLIKESKNYRRGVFYDAWKNPIIITLSTNKNNEIGLIMHSFGKNKLNDNGKGDDIIIQFNGNMSMLHNNRGE